MSNVCEIPCSPLYSIILKLTVPPCFSFRCYEVVYNFLLVYRVVFFVIGQHYMRLIIVKHLQ
jgi:hypothetical protein